MKFKEHDGLDGCKATMKVVTDDEGKRWVVCDQCGRTKPLPETKRGQRREEMTREQLKARMRRRCVKIRDDAAQLIRDTESWNDNRPEEMPFDCGAERVLVDLCNQAISALDHDDMAEHSRLSKLMVAQAELAAATE